MGFICVVLAAPSLEPLLCNFYRKGSQFHIETKVKNTPNIRVYFYEGTNAFTATGYNAYFKYAKDNSSTPVVTLTGSVSGAYCDFATTTNTFPYEVDSWYAEVQLESTNGTQLVSIEGLVTVKRSF